MDLLIVLQLDIVFPPRHRPYTILGAIALGRSYLEEDQEKDRADRIGPSIINDSYTPQNVIET